MKVFYWTSIIVLVFSKIASAGPMTLEEFLKFAETKNKNIKAYEIQTQVALSKQKSGDMSLSPSLTFKGSYLTDKKLPNFLGNSEAKVTQYSLIYGQKFSTGTQISLSASAIENSNPGIQNPTLASSFGQYSTGMLGVSITQSLWKDAFGAATSLRHQRESLQYQLEKTSLELQRRQALIELETMVWDLVYFQEEQKQKKESIDRAKKIVQWVSRRVNDGIGDKSDLLNAQALLASRELQYVSSVDESRATLEKIRSFLNLSEGESLPELKVSLNQGRNILLLPDNSVRMDAYLTSLESQMKSVVVSEVKEASKADLVLSANYNTNGYEAGGNISSASNSWAKTDTPTQSVSLMWTYLFDTESKNSLVSSAQGDSLASELKREQKKMESNSALAELKRRYLVLSKRIEILSNLSKIQEERAKVEQDKLIKGRTITSQVITSEQDAADSALSLIKMKAEQRKLETQAQIFITKEVEL